VKKFLSTRFCEKFGVELPIIQAPMAGNITSPQLVAAVSEAGGLGTLAGAYVKPDALRQAIREIKQLTKRPFGVNLLLYGQAEAAGVTPEYIDWMNEMREAVGLPRWSGELQPYTDEIDECFSVIMEEKVPVFSVAFSLPGRYGNAARQAGMKLIGTATTLAEARRLSQEGVDAIAAQGGEAGGHRGTFRVDEKEDGECIGTMPLVSLLAEALPDTPIVAAGGIMNGQGIIAALSLGADAVQLGTRFLACRESLAHPSYKQKVLSANETDTRVTRAFSGRPARGITNRMIDSFHRRQVAVPPYPIQNHLTREIRNAAARRGDADFLFLLAGQGVAMVREEETASEIMGKLVAEAEQAARRIQSLCFGK
jgi:nitronate monooxygenase